VLKFALLVSERPEMIQRPEMIGGRLPENECGEGNISKESKKGG
jgi:hypothetical protein